MRTDDPVRDFLRHEADREEELEGLPECELCGEPIQDETCFCVGGNKYHKTCFIHEYEFYVDDLAEIDF